MGTFYVGKRITTFWGTVVPPFSIEILKQKILIDLGRIGATDRSPFQLPLKVPIYHCSSTLLDRGKNQEESFSLVPKYYTVVPTNTSVF